MRGFFFRAQHLHQARRRREPRDIRPPISPLALTQTAAPRGRIVVEQGIRMTDRPSPARAAHARGSRRASTARWCAHAFRRVAAMLFALLASPSIAHADPDPVVFESHAAGDFGGGLAVGTNPVGVTFRLLQRTALSEIGIHARGNGTQTVYGALYRIATPDTVPDVAGDNRLVGTTLLQPRRRTPTSRVRSRRRSNRAGTRSRSAPAATARRRRPGPSRCRTSARRGRARPRPARRSAHTP